MQASPSLLRVDAVLFDVDGTLVNSITMIVNGLGDAYERFLGQRPGDDVLRSLIGRSLADQMNLFGLGETQPDQTGERCEYTLAQFRRYEDTVSLYQPAVEALLHCQSLGIGVALVTSKDRNEFAAFIEKFPVFRSVDVVMTASDTERPKPSPDPALGALDALGVSAERAIMIGDAVFDMECARTAGVTAYGVSYALNNEAALRSAGAERVLRTPEALLALTQNEFAPSQWQENQRNLPKLT